MKKNFHLSKVKYFFQVQDGNLPCAIYVIDIPDSKILDPDTDPKVTKSRFQNLESNIQIAKSRLQQTESCIQDP